MQTRWKQESGWSGTRISAGALPHKAYLRELLGGDRDSTLGSPLVDLLEDLPLLLREPSLALELILKGDTELKLTLREIASILLDQPELPFNDVGIGGRHPWDPP